MLRQELSRILPNLRFTSSKHEEVRLAGLDPVNNCDHRPRDDRRHSGRHSRSGRSRPLSNQHPLLYLILATTSAGSMVVASWWWWVCLERSKHVDYTVLQPAHIKYIEILIQESLYYRILCLTNMPNQAKPL
jgi:hypothetical protein